MRRCLINGKNKIKSSVVFLGITVFGPTYPSFWEPGGGHSKLERLKKITAPVSFLKFMDPLCSIERAVFIRPQAVTGCHHR